MASLLSNLLNNLSKGIHRINCKFRHIGKNVKHVKLNTNIATIFIEYTNFKDDLIEYKCLCCKNTKQNYEHKLDEKL